MFKKTAAFVLAVCMLFCLSACRKDDALSRANAAIKKGNYAEAYIILNNTRDRTEKEEELFSKFKFVTLTLNGADSDGNSDKTTCSFDERGNILSYQYLSFGDYDSCTEKAFTYDDKGRKLTEEHTDSNGGWCEQHTYDKKGHLLTSETRSASGVWTRVEYSRDAKGNVLLEEHISSDGTSHKYEYTYDKRGNELTFLSTDIFGDQSTSDSTYDKQGRILSSKHVSSDGSITEYEFTYDKKGNVLTYYYSDDGVWESANYTYDKNGNMLTEDYEYSDGKWRKHKYTYDDNGRELLREVSCSAGDWSDVSFDGTGFDLSEGGRYKIESTYDENGNLKNEACYTADGSWININCTYDEEGRLLTDEREHSYRDSDSGGSKTTYKYDEDGLVLSEKVRFSFGGYEKTTHTYTREKNTLIRHTSFASEGRVSEATYQLFYYPDGIPDDVDYLS